MQWKNVWIFTILSAVLPFTQIKANNLKERFDSIYYKVLLETSISDTQKSLKIADSLYQHSASDELKIRSLLLSAYTYQIAGDVTGVFEKALEAEKLAEKTKNHEWQIRIIGLLSSELREIGLENERKKVLKKMKNTIPKIKDEMTRNLLFSMYHQELAYNYFGEIIKDEVWGNIEKSKKYLDKIPEMETKNMLMGINEWVYANTYIGLKENPDSALFHIRKAEKYFENSADPNYFKDMVLLTKGSAYLLKNEFDKAYDYLKEAETLIEETENATSKLMVYSQLYDYYYLVNDTVNSYKYLTQVKRLKNHINDNKVRPLEVFIENLNDENQFLEKKNQVVSMIFTLFCLGLLAFVFIYFYVRRKTRNKIKELKAKLESFNSESLIQEKSKVVKSTPKVVINEEVNQKILDGLEEFVQSKGFLKSNITIADLSSELNVNIKYLSHVLNHDLGKDFNKFINENRIYYILDKLYNDEKYRLYKLSVLAEECGFSSHAKFSSVFKSVTGMTPSAFVKKLNNEQDKRDENDIK